MATRDVSPFVALRGSQGVWLAHGPPNFTENESFPRSTSRGSRVMTFSVDGNLFAYCDGTSVEVIDVKTNGRLCELSLPRTSQLKFSPCNTLLATWEPYQVTKDQPHGNPNLNIWLVRTGELVKNFIQKKLQGWAPQWSADEGICARNVNNEVHFYEKNNFGVISHKLQLAKVQEFSIPEQASPPYHVAAYVPGSKGQPSFVRLYQYPNFGGPNSALANKSFYKADRSEMIWNKKGTALLLLTASETSAESYYGEQGLHYVPTNGESCLVPRSKNGPVYHVEWNPQSTEFCCVYGFMPAKATLFSLKCEPVFDFGTGPRNLAYYNAFGNILVLAGFGNLQGNIEFWDIKTKKMISKPKAPDTTYFEWSPDGTHVMTATTAPRLRVGNGYKIWHYTGTLVYENHTESSEELWEATWQTALDGQYPEPRISYKPIAGVDGVVPKAEAAPAAYVPPALRGKEQPDRPTAPRYREEYEAPSNVKQQAAAQENMSKAALKNKKKREAKQRAKEGAAAEDSYDSRPDTAVSATTTVAATGDPEVKKKKVPTATLR